MREPWPSIEVGSVKSPEDAVLADVNGDGWLNVVSSCEGKQQAVFFHLNPGRAAAPDRIRKSTAGTTESVPASVGYTRWMFCEPLDGRSLRRFDVDDHGDDDIVYSDRKGPFRSVGWLENPSASIPAT